MDQKTRARIENVLGTKGLKDFQQLFSKHSLDGLNALQTLINEERRTKLAVADWTKLAEGEFIADAALALSIQKGIALGAAEDVVAKYLDAFTHYKI
jgi:hypothetical protein